ncbi:Tyrosinase [Dactylellina cionopaga]|nr:Tyrosinase [Dactylellina cionopaga]
MAGWSSLKYAFVASCAFGLTQVQGLPAADGTSELASSSQGLFRRQQAITVTGVREGTSQGNVPVRKEIRQMIQNRDEFELFLLALQKFYAQPQSIDASYFSVSGIHGRPYRAWGGVGNAPGANANTGYCTHSDLLFLPWHRPYLALYEQLVWEHARQVVDEFPDQDPRKAQFRAVLPALRIPYWDWAQDASVPREVGELKNIDVANPKGGRQSIPNPLYSYKFQDLDGIVDSPFNRMQETFRYPRQTGGRYESQPAALNSAMTGIGGNLRNRVYQLLTSYKQFNQVGTTANRGNNPNFFDSIEGVHDTVHGTVGSGGHMGWVSYSAFDPIFWLHHTNIDRIFALWQGINPTAYTLTGTSGMGTFAIPRGTAENMNTGLAPFRQSGNSFFTSASVTKTSAFGYAYPETVNFEAGRGTPGDVIASVNRLYGRQTPSGSLREAGRIARRKRSLGEKMKRADAQPSTDLNVPPTPENLAPIEHEIVDRATDKYQEWVTNIKVNSAALNGTFNLNIFFGDAPADPKEWIAAANFVGSHAVFTDPKADHNDIVTGIVPLTSALLNKVVGKDLENLLPEAVVPYLMKNLKCLASITETAQPIDLKNIKDLNIVISAADVVLPRSTSDAPQWGQYETKLDFVDVAAGKFGPTPGAGTNSTAPALRRRNL